MLQYCSRTNSVKAKSAIFVSVMYYLLPTDPSLQNSFIISLLADFFFFSVCPAVLPSHFGYFLCGYLISTVY